MRHHSMIRVISVGSFRTAMVSLDTDGRLWRKDDLDAAWRPMLPPMDDAGVALRIADVVATGNPNSPLVAVTADGDGWMHRDGRNVGSEWERIAPLPETLHPADAAEPLVEVAAERARAAEEATAGAEPYIDPILRGRPDKVVTVGHDALGRPPAGMSGVLFR